jgi:hypothetical protein
MRCGPAGELVRLEAIELEAIQRGIFEQHEGTEQAGGAMSGAARGTRNLYGVMRCAPEHVFVP